MANAFQSPPSKTSASDPGDRSTEFVAVEGGKDTTSTEALLTAAYVGMWAIVLTFLLFGWRRQGRLEARLGTLERALAKAEDRPA